MFLAMAAKGEQLMPGKWGTKLLDSSFFLLSLEICSSFGSPAQQAWLSSTAISSVASKIQFFASCSGL